MAISPGARRAIIQSVLPKMKDLGKEMHAELYVRTHRDTGDMKSDTYASLDNESGELQVGYDETGRTRPHAFYEIMGTSEREGHPSLQETVYRKRSPR